VSISLLNLAKALEAQALKECVALARGSAQDYPAYREGVGRIAGLLEVRRQIVEQLDPDTRRDIASVI
jgi:hypothetical protein